MKIKTTQLKLAENGWKTRDNLVYEKKISKTADIELVRPPLAPDYAVAYRVGCPDDFIAIGKELKKLEKKAKKGRVESRKGI